MENTPIIQDVLHHLEKLYPRAPLGLQYTSPFELLVAVILSAQCTDDRVNRVTTGLFKKYRSPSDYLKVPPRELENDIRPTGFYRNKARLLRACCEKLVTEFEEEIPRDIDRAVTLPGVGRKTAAMVLGNAYDQQAGIAVDTHVKRVANRLQLSTRDDPEKIEKDLQILVQREKWTWFSNAMILFGRNICQSRHPQCPSCPFRNRCPSPEKQL